MKIFLSWSGGQSRQLATALHAWLPDILHFVEPWMSDADISAGQRWGAEVGKALESTNFGILCVTRENLEAAWLLFEAGALAKSMAQGTVIPFLLDVQFGEILSGPLGQFQAKKVDGSGAWELVSAINRLADSQAIDDARLRRLFDRLWPDLEQTILHIAPNEQGSHPRRSIDLILEELVGAVRNFDLRLADVERGIATPDYSSSAMLLLRTRETLAELPLETVAEEARISEELLSAYVGGEIDLVPGSQPYYSMMRWQMRRMMDEVNQLYEKRVVQNISREKPAVGPAELPRD
jgi:hypothetical protein